LSDTEFNQLKFTSHHFYAGVRKFIPISLFVAIFGAAFGLAASQTGIDNLSAVLMSGAVFAGASQFGTLDLWGTEVPLLPLIVTVFAINARHLLMGASLYPWLKQLPPIKRYAFMMVASDANWAMSLQAFNRNELSKALGIFLGGGLTMWVFWIIGTWLGLYFGGAISDPKAFGLDMVMSCFLLTMVLEGKKDTRTSIIWVGAATSSIIAYLYLPENSHVFAGAIVGGLLGITLKEQNNEH